MWRPLTTRRWWWCAAPSSALRRRTRGPSADDKDWATATWRRVPLTWAPDLVTEVDLPGESLEGDAPTLSRRRDGWYAVAGPPGHLTSPVEMKDATWLTTRGDDGEVTLWVRRTAAQASPPAYRAQR